MKHVLCALLLLLALPAAAAATNEGTRSPWTYTNTIGVTGNPSGLLDLLWARFQTPLYDSSNPLLEQNFFAFTGGVDFSPVYLRPVVKLEVQPLSVLQFAVHYEPIFFYGNNGFLPSYPDATATWVMPLTKSVPDSPSHGHASLVHQVMVSGTLQFAHGPVAFQNVVRGLWSHMSAHGSDRAFYSVDDDILLARVGWELKNDTVLLYNFDFGLSAGVAHTLIATAYPPESYLRGASRVNLNSPISRLGPLLLFKFNDRHTGQFQRPTLIVGLEWYLKHRYRTGLDVPRGVPFGLLAFSFSGDL